MGVHGRHLTILAELAVAACSGLRARVGAGRVPGGLATLARGAALLLAGASAGALAETHRLPLLPSASDALREGVVRILNHSGEAGRVDVTAIDDSGAAFGPVALPVGARHAVEFTSTDLERGNAGKGIPTGIGGGQGDWRLVLETELAIEPLVYVRTPAGFAGGLGAGVPRRSFYHRIPLPAPGAEFANGGRLRLIDAAGGGAEVVIFGLDDAGRLGSGPVVAALPAGGALSVHARGLERGAAGLSGRLGGGTGDWRLMVFASAPIEAMALLDNPAGPLANLSGAAAQAGDIPWFAPADDPLRQGSLRIASRSGDGEVLIHAVDDAGRDPGPVTLTVDGAGTIRLDSGDLERGNAARGLPAGIGDGDGGWRLRLESALSLDAASYLRTPDGFLTAVNEAAGEGNRRHYVPLFHAAGGAPPRSLLRLINPSAEAARVAILGWDDDGEIAPEGGVGLTLLAGASRTLDAAALEEGAEGLSGRFGQGRGAWRLALKSDRDVRAMNLAESAAGHLADLGTSAALDRFPDTCFDGPDSDGDGVADGCLGGAQPAPLELAAGGCSDGRYVADPADNPGLAGDCRVMVALAQALARNGELADDHPMREWGDRRHTEMDEWEGVVIKGGRVAGIDLAGGRGRPGGLAGPIPADLFGLTALTELDLSFNRLAGPIPEALARLTRLKRLDLSYNLFTGEVPAALTDLAELRELNVENNRLSGTVPWVFRERAAPDGGLATHYGGNAIAGLAPPPRAPAQTFPPDPAANGNAAHHSVAYFQGPLVWEWDWRGDPVERQTPVLGRWAALAVRIEHATEQPPPVATRVLDADGAVLAEGLAQAAPPSTEPAGTGVWRTEYVFELPGALHRAGNRVVHVIDPDNVMAETDETDNTGEPIRLYGEEAPRLRITFFPVHPAGQEPPPLDADRLMRGIHALWPIPDDFEVAIAPPFETAAANQFELLADLRALWNAEADPDEFYFGIFDQPWTAGRGVAYRPGRVAVSEFSEFNTIPHEFGHNLDLRHTPGCGVLGPDWKYPYPNGGLGGMPGWDLNWRHRVSGEDDNYADIMSYCGVRQFVSDYNYRKVLGNWLETAAAQPSAATLHVVMEPGDAARLGPAGAGGGAGDGAGAGAGGGDLSANGSEPPANGGEPSATGTVPPTDTDRVESPPDPTGALALSGRIDAGGAWSLTHALQTRKGPRPPSPDAAHTLILLDAQGRELHREPLAAQALSHGEGGGWAARVPLPATLAREIVILDARGTPLLRQALPTQAPGGNLGP